VLLATTALVTVTSQSAFVTTQQTKKQERFFKVNTGVGFLKLKRPSRFCPRSHDKPITARVVVQMSTKTQSARKLAKESDEFEDNDVKWDLMAWRVASQ